MPNVVADVTRSPQKVFGDLSNMHSKDVPDELKTETNEMSTSLPMQSPTKGDPNAERSFEEIRDSLDKALFAKICEAVHHDKSNHTIEDEVEEVVEEVLTKFYPKEHVYFRHKGQGHWGYVDFSEKRGAMLFYHMKVDGSRFPERLEGQALKRKYTPSEKDVKILIENVAEKEVGKPWAIKAVYREEFGIKDKFASIFCTTPKAKKNLPSTTGREQNGDDSSSEDEEEVVNRRLSMGLPAAGVKKKAVQKVEKKEAKQKEKKDKKEKKEKTEKKPKKENGGALNKFVTNTPGNNTSSPFMSPTKRGEKRFYSSVEKLTDAWKKRDYSAFLLAATQAAKVLNGVQIEAIPNDCHKFAVRRVFNKEKDKDQLKKLSKDAKKDFRERMANERKVLYKTMDAKIKNYFSGKQEVDDLCVDLSDLACPGRLVDSVPERAALFPECFMITQFIASLRQFIDGEGSVSAENLLTGLHEGRSGFMQHTVQALIPLLSTLIQDEEYKKHTHFAARLREFHVIDTNASELCRALLIGKTSKDKGNKRAKESDSDEEGQQTADESKEDGENAAEEDAENKFNLSQIELEEQKELLDVFTADKEMWQLSPDVQLDILRNLVNRILDLASCRDYLDEGSLSEEGKSLKSRLTKTTAQVNGWQAELAKLPEVDESIDETLLSRHQTRERAETQRKRDNLERKIEDSQDKLEEMVGKMELEKAKQAQSKRLTPVGEDRHFRRYFWVPHKTSDAGIWIQNFGKTGYEKYIRDCIAKAQPINSEDEPLESNGDASAVSKEAVTCDDENSVEYEKWFHVDNVQVLTQFTESLKNGPRERALKKFFTTNMENIMRSIQLGSRENTQSPALVEKDEEMEEKKEENEEKAVPSTSGDLLDGLKSTVIQLASDLRDGYLTTIDLGVLEAKVVSAEKLKHIKEGIEELVDTINPSNIVVKLDMMLSHFIMEKWKNFLSVAANPSAVHLLLSFLDSRINWKNSVTEKRCSCCRSNRSPEAKIACDVCATVVHYYCTRPRLLEKPTEGWSCAGCSRQTVLQERRAAAAKRINYADSDTAEDDDEEEEEEQAENAYDSDAKESDDDAFAAKNKNRKRVLVESDYEDDDDTPKKTETKRRKEASDHLEECIVVMEKIKDANRLYRCLQMVPVKRGSRRKEGVSLELIEKKLDEYNSFEEFVADLHTFFATAKEYFENHNERKLEEFEVLVLSLDLPESK